jgi:hypothetical protein
MFELQDKNKNQLRDEDHTFCSNNPKNKSGFIQKSRNQTQIE